MTSAAPITDGMTTRRYAAIVDSPFSSDSARSSTRQFRVAQGHSRLLVGLHHLVDERNGLTMQLDDRPELGKVGQLIARTGDAVADRLDLRFEPHQRPRLHRSRSSITSCRSERPVGDVRLAASARRHLEQMVQQRDLQPRAPPGTAPAEAASSEVVMRSAALGWWRSASTPHAGPRAASGFR